MSNEIPQRIGSLHPNIAPYGEIFETKDKAQIVFAIGSNKHFGILCEFLELSNISVDHKFSTNKARVENRIELKDHIQKKVGWIASADILSFMEVKKVPCGKVKNLKEVFADKSAKDLILNEEIENQNTKRIRSAIFKWK